MFNILDKIEEEYPHHTFGCNKENEVFVDGVNTHIKITQIDDIDISESLEKMAVEEAVKHLKKELLIKKFIHEEVKEV